MRRNKCRKALKLLAWVLHEAKQVPKSIKIAGVGALCGEISAKRH